MPPKINIERRTSMQNGRKRRWKFKRITKVITFVLTWVFVWMFFAGAEITINYNKEKAQKARKNFWDKTLSVIRYVGNIKKAMF